LIWGLEIREQSLAKRIRQHAFDNGLILELCGARNNVLKILPPLIINEEDLLEGLTILENAIVHASGHLKRRVSRNVNGTAQEKKASHGCTSIETASGAAKLGQT
jgi:diaminobutyrate-2-oxoglutarate transaminase